MPVELQSPSRPWVRPVVFEPAEGAARGPTLLALPTAHGDWHCLEPSLAPLAARGLRVALLSLRGERAQGPVPSWVLDDLVEDAVEAVALLGGAPVAVMGTSVGGTVALALAERRPELVSRLVLNATAARLAAHERTRRVLESVPGPLRGLLFHGWAMGRCLPEILALGMRAGGGPGRLVGALRRLLGFALRHRSPRPTLLARVALMLDVDLEPGLGSVSCPTLVLTGEADLDRLVPFDCQRPLLDRLPDARHHVVAGTGHLGLLTRPEEVGVAVADFLLAGARGRPAPSGADVHA